MPSPRPVPTILPNKAPGIERRLRVARATSDTPIVDPTTPAAPAAPTVLIKHARSSTPQWLARPTSPMPSSEPAVPPNASRKNAPGSRPDCRAVPTVHELRSVALVVYASAETPARLTATMSRRSSRIAGIAGVRGYSLLALHPHVSGWHVRIVCAVTCGLPANQLIVT